MLPALVCSLSALAWQPFTTHASSTPLSVSRTRACRATHMAADDFGQVKPTTFAEVQQRQAGIRVNFNDERNKLGLYPPHCLSLVQFVVGPLLCATTVEYPRLGDAAARLLTSNRPLTRAKRELRSAVSPTSAVAMPLKSVDRR